jgi:hypothetical protein
MHAQWLVGKIVAALAGAATSSSNPSVHNIYAAPLVVIAAGMKRSTSLHAMHDGICVRSLSKSISLSQRISDAIFFFFREYAIAYHTFIEGRKRFTRKSLRQTACLELQPHTLGLLLTNHCRTLPSPPYVQLSSVCTPP